MSVSNLTIDTKVEPDPLSIATNLKLVDIPSIVISVMTIIFNGSNEIILF